MQEGAAPKETVGIGLLGATLYVLLANDDGRSDGGPQVYAYHANGRFALGASVSF